MKLFTSLQKIKQKNPKQRGVAVQVQLVETHAPIKMPMHDELNW